MGTHTLVLNASFEPLNVVSWQRALQLLFQGKVEVVEESARSVRTVKISIRVPTVLRLLAYVPLKTKKQIIRFSRTNVFIRDNYRCQYCGRRANKSNLTLDHVIPAVKGGGRNWENIVTSCKECNQRKGGRNPREAGMRLKKPPRRPNWLPRNTIEVGVTVMPDSWRAYLVLKRKE